MLPRPTPGTSLALWSCPNLQERLAAALSCSHRSSRQHLPARSRLLPSATLQLRAAFSLSLRLPSVGRLAFRWRMEKNQDNHLLSSLGAEIHSEKQSLLWERYPGQDPPTGGWDRVLGTQKQQWCTLVYHLTGCWVLLGGPHPEVPSSALLSFVSGLPVAQLVCMWKDRPGRAVGRG